MTPYKELLHNINHNTQYKGGVAMGNGTTCKIKSTGNIQDLPVDALLVPDLTSTLLSIPQLDEAGATTIIKDGTLLTFKPDDETAEAVDHILHNMHNEYNTIMASHLHQGLYRGSVQDIKGLNHVQQANISLYPRIQVAREGSISLVLYTKHWDICANTTSLTSSNTHVMITCRKNLPSRA